MYCFLGDGEMPKPESSAAVGTLDNKTLHDFTCLVPRLPDI